MQRLSRRSALRSSLAFAAGAASLAACSAAPQTRSGLTRVYVLGMIHSGHLTSETYSLGVLEAAIRKAKPDVILTEIPPDRIAKAISSFSETDEITEPRAAVFPEYTDVVFPLSRELDFEILGTAGWTREMADNRREALRRIEAAPERAVQWAEHIQARREFSRRLAGRGDDPSFIHTDEFDQLVEAGYTPYQRYFDADLGPGGWTQINDAHTALITAALDAITGQGLTALVTFGSAHKYKILQSLETREDIVLSDPRSLFEKEAD
ncbi:MAG: hypothetical protein HRT64_08745 [Erythrobacter sp.]|nr:hypothetical protein [Erythrobacter sp.]